MISKVYDLSEVSEMLTLTRDGSECQAAQDERDYFPPLPKSHLFFIYRSKNMPQMIQAFHQAAVGVLTVAAGARGRGKRTESVRMAAGAARCFQVQLEQMVLIRAQCEKQNTQTVANSFKAVGLENITYT